MCGHSAESRTLMRQRLGGLGALIAEVTLLGRWQGQAVLGLVVESV